MGNRYFSREIGKSGMFHGGMRICRGNSLSIALPRALRKIEHLALCLLFDTYSTGSNALTIIIVKALPPVLYEK